MFENTCPAPVFEFISDGNTIVYFADSALQGVKKILDRPRKDVIEKVERSLYARVRVAAHAQFYITGYMLARSLLSTFLLYLEATVHFLEEVLISLDTLHAKEEVVKGNAESAEQTKKVSFYSFHYFLVS